MDKGSPKFKIGDFVIPNNDFGLLKKTHIYKICDIEAGQVSVYKLKGITHDLPSHQNEAYCMYADQYLIKLGNPKTCKILYEN